MLVDDRPLPVVLAPMAGGPSTPELAAAVSGAGGLGFLAAGYLTAERLAEDVGRIRKLTDEPFGVNLFVPAPPSDLEAVTTYAAALAPEADRAGVDLGQPRWSDDEFDAKAELLLGDPPAAVSFAFGLPPAAVVERLHAAGSEVWMTVTTPEDAEEAEKADADVLVVQGIEAGGHRGGLRDEGEAFALLPLLQMIAAANGTPMVAAGGITTGAGIAAALAAGARAAALGSAFLRCPEAGTAPVHRKALTGRVPTALTRAFTGRTARAIRNRLVDEHPDAPAAYPEVHFVTAPLRAAGRAAGDPASVNLFAGQAYPLASDLPAAELVRRLHDEARTAAGRAATRLG